AAKCEDFGWRTRGCICFTIAQKPLTKISAGYVSLHDSVLSRALAFVSCEKEQAILLNRTTDSRTKSVAHQMAGNVRLTCLEFCLLKEPVIGLAQTRPVVFVKRAVELVGSTLGYQRDLSSTGTTRFRIGIAGNDPELLKRVEGRTECSLKCVAADLVIVIDSVNGHVGLVAPRAADRAAPAVNIGIDAVAVTGKYDAWLQTENRDRVSAFGRQVFDLRDIERVTLRGILGVHERRCIHHLDDRGATLHFQHFVDGGWGIDHQPNALNVDGSKPRRFDGQAISAGRDLKKLINTLNVGLHRPGKPGVGIFDGHFRL